MTERDRARSGIEELAFFVKSREMVVVFLASFLVVWLAPGMTGDGSGWFQALLGDVREIFPFMGRYVEKSNIKEVSEVYFPVMFVVTVLVGVHVVRGRDFYFVEFRRRKALKPIKYGIIAIGFSMVMFLGSCFLIFLGGGDAYAITPIGRSRMALAIFGWFYAGGAVWGAVAAAVNFIYILKD